MKPHSKPQATREQIIDMLVDQGLWNDREISTVCVVGVRGYYLNSMGKPGVNDRGQYDDAIFVLTADSCTSFNANTDPSIYRAGRAQLMAPQKVTYRPGYHGYGRKSGHPAFRQTSSVIVKRDDSRGNGKALGGGVFTDEGTNRFWINLHKGGRNTTSSAGCPTIPPSQWTAFYNLLRHELRKHNQSSFNYYLVENK
eukprot:Seg16874.1 transcript_id=Seg16874.1/GoldUCD/mRNA.D3Y31 product="hypothetical protein" protein_id=Seg16874.1/GoldUCD/D3Y31